MFYKGYISPKHTTLYAMSEVMEDDGKALVKYFLGYLETFNLETGFTREEYCFVDIEESCIKVRLEEYPDWMVLGGYEVAPGYFKMAMHSGRGAADGMLHQATGYGELEDYIEFDDTPCLIKVQLIKRFRDDGTITHLGE